jgi:hypothetical protein
MKKVLIVIVLFMAVLAVNAQATKTTDTKEKGIRTPVMVADLQKPITDNIAKDYVGYTIAPIKEIARELSEEYGRLNLFALSEREDLKDKWDVLISVSIPSEKKKELINKVITKFRTKLQPSELIQISRFVFLEPNHAFVQNINYFTQVENSDIEIRNGTINNIRIGHAIVISSYHNPN